MVFHEVRFPANLSAGAIGGPERRTSIFTLSSGFEHRSTSWHSSRRRYEASSGIKSLDDISYIISFFEARQGMLYGFRWKDWSDYKSCLPSDNPSYLDQIVGYGDGKIRKFQFKKSYRSGNISYERIIRKVVDGTFSIAISGDEKIYGVDYSIDNNGIIEFKYAPDIGTNVTAGFEFDVPVRFDTDSIMISVSSFNSGDIPSIPVIELKL